MTAQVTNHNDGFFYGVIQHVQVNTIYWGSTWQTDPALQDNRQRLDNFYRMIVNSKYMDMLGKYTSTAVTRSGPVTINVQRGSFQSSDVTGQYLPGTVLTEQQVQNQILTEIASGRSAAPITGSLYVLYLPPGVTTQFAQQNNAGGYHFNIDVPVGGGVYRFASYAVIPYPNYASDSYNAIQAQTIIGSHELTEAVTNVRTVINGTLINNGEGWWNPDDGREAGPPHLISPTE